MTRSLNTHITRVLMALTVIAFAAMYFGMISYYIIYTWLFPNENFDEWGASDFLFFGVMLITGLAAAIFASWRLAQSIVRPLRPVAAAARAIAGGDFSARAQDVRPAFG